MKNNIIYMLDFLCKIEILLLNILKLIKISGFFQVFVQNSSLFFQISQVLGFSRFPGKMATLINP